MSKRLIYEEDALANLQNDRFIIGQIGMIHSKSAIKSAPSVDPLEALGIGRCEDCANAWPWGNYECSYERSDYLCTAWGLGCSKDEFCPRFKRRSV